MKNDFAIYYKEFADYFDYFEIRILLPEIRKGGIGLVSEDYGHCPHSQEQYILDFPSRLSYESDYRRKQFILRCFGFGLSFRRAFGYYKAV